MFWLLFMKRSWSVFLNQAKHSSISQKLLTRLIITSEFSCKTCNLNFFCFNFNMKAKVENTDFPERYIFWTIKQQQRQFLIKIVNRFFIVKCSQLFFCKRVGWFGWWLFVMFAENYCEKLIVEFACVNTSWVRHVPTILHWTEAKQSTLCKWVAVHFCCSLVVWKLYDRYSNCIMFTSFLLTHIKNRNSN